MKDHCSLFIPLIALVFSPVLRAAIFTVSNTADSGTGSLRQALANASSTAGADTVVFAPVLNGGTITLNSEIHIIDTNALTVDARSLTSGLTIDGGTGTNRIFTMSGGPATFIGLALTGGNGTGGNVSGAAGAINNSGTLILTRCSLNGNTVTGAGGAIRNNAAGNLTLNQCALFSNAAGSGGAISNSGTLSLSNCTISGNTSTSSGGGIQNNQSSAVILVHCTVSDNRAGGGAGTGGGGIHNSGTATLNNSIIAGNNLTGTGTGPDILNETGAMLTRTGVSILQTAIIGAGAVNGTGSSITTNPRLAPLSSNGGPTKTMSLLPGSPALDAVPTASIVAGLTADQRGLPRSRDGDTTAGAIPDIGAYEAQIAPLSLGFNFNGDSPRNLVEADVAGAPEFAQSHWNNLSGASGSSTAPRTLSGGSGATLRTDWGAPSTWAINSGTPVNAHQKLMWGYLDSNSMTSSGTNLYDAQNQPFFAVNDLPADLILGGYRVVVYADTAGPDPRTAEYWLTTYNGDPANVTDTTDISPHLFLRDTSNLTAFYVRVPATSLSGAGAAAGNYLVFENQSQDGFILRTEEAGGTVPRAVINGLQVFRNEVIAVTTAQDENHPVSSNGSGISLREALRDVSPGMGIVFDASVNGASIALDTELVVTKNVTVDASSLSGGITLNGQSNTRIFRVESGVTCTLSGVTLSNGEAANAEPPLNGDGGGIYNSGTLTLNRCFLTGNSAPAGSGQGGGVFNVDGARLTVNECILADNSAVYGGGIYNGTTVASYQNSGAILTVNRSTFVNNSVSNSGGGISNIGTMVVNQSTFAGNSADSGGGGGIFSSSHVPGTVKLSTFARNSAGVGGAIINHGPLEVSHSTFARNSAGAIDNRGALVLANSIVALNTATESGGDIVSGTSSTITLFGSNVVQRLSGDGVVSGPAFVDADPLLAPLGNYGGLTQTLALLPGSPARNAATGSSITSDQRGFPIIGVPDIGAYEAGTLDANFNAYIYETLPATATAPQHASTFDFDGDGLTNGDEFNYLTNAASGTSFFAPASTTDGTSLHITFQSAAGRTYTLERSDTLAPGSWVNTGLTAISGDGSVKSFTVPATTPDRRFYRVQAAP